MKRNGLRLLDLYCCAGGAARGYWLAGYTIVGVDIDPQPNYPYQFIQADALEFATDHGHAFDVIHASPPCQRYSQASYCQPIAKYNHPDLVEHTRNVLTKLERPYVIENVPQAPLINPILLCGVMFDLNVFRHRLFESNVELHAPPHIPHGQHRYTNGTYTSLLYRAMFQQKRMVTKAGVEGDYIIVAGNSYNKNKGAMAMGLDPEQMTKKELTESIPPAYTYYLGKQLLKVLL